MIELKVHWVIAGQQLDSRLAPLLHAIAVSGSLSQAARALGLSYRHAWGMLGALEAALGAPLVKRARGRGAHLTSLGERFVAAGDALTARIEPLLADEARELSRRFALGRAPAGGRLAVRASHDLALSRLRDLIAQSDDCRVDLHFQGSLDCLAALARGECDFAGFHVPDLPDRTLVLAQYQPWLAGRNLRLVHFVTRSQGLMVAPGNPHKLAGVAGLARAGIRFVNRQPGSGTRLAFDHLLAAHRIQAAAITGYEVEEFTHAAVAATIASGMADAGFGIEAAARRHGLAFVPVLTERYYLAARAATLARADARAFFTAAAGAAFRAILMELPGYTAPTSMAPQSVAAALGVPARAIPVKSSGMRSPNSRSRQEKRTRE